jgi:hypothetical protein
MCTTCGCGDPNKNIIPVFDDNSEGGGGDSGKTVEVIAGNGIEVADESDVDTWRHRVSLETYTALSANISIIAKELGVAKSSPILKGTVIDALEIDWSYNKAVTSQTLSNTAGLTPPVLDDADRSYDYADQSITSNMSVTIQGNDGEGVSGSIDSDTASISFGNLMWLGFGLTRVGTLASSLEAFIEAFATSVVKTSRSHTYYATGGSNQKHFVAYPKAWGLATFKKGIFEGGYVRLKNVGGTLVQDAGVNPELDITITNSKGHAEAYYIYESLYDNQNDAVTPFILS